MKRQGIRLFDRGRPRVSIWLLLAGALLGAGLCASCAPTARQVQARALALDLPTTSEITLAPLADSTRLFTIDTDTWLPWRLAIWGGVYRDAGYACLYANQPGWSPARRVAVRLSPGAPWTGEINTSGTIDIVRGSAIGLTLEIDRAKTMRIVPASHSRDSLLEAYVWDPDCVVEISDSDSVLFRATNELAGPPDAGARWCDEEHGWLLGSQQLGASTARIFLGQEGYDYSPARVRVKHARTGTGR
jgi:hypothetical protein